MLRPPASPPGLTACLQSLPATVSRKSCFNSSGRCPWRHGPTVDGGNLAPLLQRRFLTAPSPLFSIGVESLQKQICSNDGNLAPPQTEQLSMLKRGYGDASSRHTSRPLCRWCKISSIHRLEVLGENIQMRCVCV